MKRILIPILGILAIFQSCKTVYVPVKGETIIKDSIIRETRIDTVKVQLPPEKVRDWTGLLDTLKMETSLATSTSWVDTTRGILTGELVNKDKPLDVPVPVSTTTEKKDSIVYQEVPVPVEVVKEVKVIPKFWMVFGIIGIVLSCVLITIGIIKIKSGKFLNLFKK